MQRIYEYLINAPTLRRTLISFLCCLIFSLSAAAQSNSPRVTIHKKDVTVIEALKEVEKQTNMSIGYNESKLQDAKRISLSLDKATLDSSLKEILSGTGYTYQIDGKYIIITPKKKETAQTAPKTRVTVSVVDENGDPLVGANVRVEGTKNVAITDIEGRSTIEVPKGAKLNVSYIGYAPYAVKVGDDTSYKVNLHNDSRVLDDVVVTALGIKRSEKALSYNVQKVDGSALTEVKDANLVNSLNGRVAGVTINKSSSGVGGASRVVLRGAKSIEGNNNALYVIDGIPMFNTTQGNTGNDVIGDGKAGSEGIADLNPEDIESISVLSGPSAAALYGSSAANGVILLTTKKGVEGRFSVTVSSSTLFSKAYRTPKFQNRYGNVAGSYQSWGDKLDTPSTYDPKDDFFNTGTTFINSATFTSGTKTNQTFASIASTNSSGIVPNNTYDRLNFTIRNTSRFLDDKLQLDLGASYINQRDKNMISQGRYYNPILAAYLFPRGESFDDIKTFERFDSNRNLGVQYWPVKDGVYATQNPYWTAYRNPLTNKKRRYIFSAGLTWYITDWVNVTARYRIDDVTSKYEKKLYASSDLLNALSPKGLYETSIYTDQQQYADVIATVNKNLGDFSLSANVGYSFSDYGNNTRGHYGPLLGVANIFSIQNMDPMKTQVIESGGDSNVRNNALFASLEVGWRSMLYMTVTGRNDWNSRLVNSKEESFFYPSVGLSAIVSQMLHLPSQITFMKVRGSYTEVGAPISVSGLTPGTITTPIVGGALKPTDIYPFSDFKAERTKSYEFGLTMRLFNKINADVTYYHSNTYNQTFLGDLAEYTGYKKIYLQAGDVENRGIEASLGYSDTYPCGLAFSTTVTYSRNINRIRKMVEGYKSAIQDEPIDIPEVLKDDGRVILKKGGSINDIYATMFLKKDSQGFVEIKSDGSYGLEEGEPVYLGHTSPSCNLGWSNFLSYKGFSLSFLVNARIGGVVTSSTEAILDRFGVSAASADARDAGGVMFPNQGRVNAKNYYSIIGTGDWSTAGYYTYSATNVRLQNLTLTYTFPSRWFNNVIRDLQISFIAENPWMIYCKAPFDPELTPSTSTYGQGNDYFMQPSTRSFGFGVKFKL